MALTLRRQGQKGENKTHCENQPFERRSTKAKQWNLDIKRVHIACGSRLVKMISKSSSVVTGLSLQTNSTFSGGFMSASGRSPIISSTTAFERAVFSLIFRRRRRYVCICIGNEQKIPLASETAEEGVNEDETEQIQNCRNAIQTGERVGHRHFITRMLCVERNILPMASIIAKNLGGVGFGSSPPYQQPSPHLLLSLELHFFIHLQRDLVPRP